MRGRLQKLKFIGSNCSLFFNTIEKILLTRRLYACNKEKVLKRILLNIFLFSSLLHQRLNVKQFTYKSKTNLNSKYSTFKPFNVNKKGLNENKEMFNQWLVGFTDGDGTFSISKSNNK
jgi:hypothetical protein